MSRLFREILKKSQEYEGDLIEMRRDFHRHPELSDEEHRTTERIADILGDAGIKLMNLNLETGVVARICGQSADGPTVALRADIDALPLEEETGLSFASENPGKMHACGHDSHITWGLGAALILKEMKEYLPGEIRLLFQPSEERGSGARTLIEAGALEGVDMIFGAHNKGDLPAGTVGVSPGYLMASTGSFQFSLQGKGGHGAMPHLSTDPIPAAASIIMSLQTVVARNTDPLESGVVSVCTLNAGTAGNIIPDRLKMSGTIRAFRPEVKELIVDRIEKIVNDTASAHDCSVQWEKLDFNIPPVKNEERASALARRAVTRTLGEEAMMDAGPVLASEDFALYQGETPGCFMWVGSGCPDYGWHHPKFAVDEACLPVGAAVLAACGLAALEDLAT